jgi:hypothetical protein
VYSYFIVNADIDYVTFKFGVCFLFSSQTLSIVLCIVCDRRQLIERCWEKYLRLNISVIIQNICTRKHIVALLIHCEQNSGQNHEIKVTDPLET